MGLRTAKVTRAVQRRRARPPSHGAAQSGPTSSPRSDAGLDDPSSLRRQTPPPSLVARAAYPRRRADRIGSTRNDGFRWSWSPAELGRRFRARKRTWSPVQVRMLWGGVVGVALGVGIGAAALSGVASVDRQQPGVSETRGNAVTTPDLQLLAPPGWSRSATIPSIPGLSPSRTVALVERASGAHILAASLPASSSALLPAALLERLLDDALKRPRRIRLRRGLTASTTGPDASRGPTANRHLCGADNGGRRDCGLLQRQRVPTAPVAECLEAAQSLRLTLSAPVQLSRDTAFWVRVAAEIRGVDAVRERTRAQLEAADTPNEQAAAALSVGTAYERAAEAVSPLPSTPPRSFRLSRNSRRTPRRTGADLTDLEDQDSVALARDRETALSANPASRPS